MIREFQGEFRWLSNFWREDGFCVEHEYQAQKFDDPRLQDIVRLQPTPGKAKRKARELQKQMRVGWGKDRVEAMRKLLEVKFRNPRLRALLLATGNEELQEGNRWGDTFWGIDLYSGKGENRLGKLLMELRERIRKGG